MIGFVKNQFQRKADEFIRRYFNTTLIDRIFRKSIFLRFEKILSECKALRFHSVLDVGCSASIQALQLTQMDINIIAIDFSDEMGKIFNR